MSKKQKTSPTPRADELKLVKEYISVREQIKDLETVLGTLKEALTESAVRRGGAFETPTHNIHMVDQERKTISRDLLVQNGVTPRVIEKSTTITQVSFVRVDAKKDKQEKLF